MRRQFAFNWKLVQKIEPSWPTLPHSFVSLSGFLHNPLQPYWRAVSPQRTCRQLTKIDSRFEQIKVNHSQLKSPIKLSSEFAFLSLLFSNVKYYLVFLPYARAIRKSFNGNLIAAFHRIIIIIIFIYRKWRLLPWFVRTCGIQSQAMSQHVYLIKLKTKENMLDWSSPLGDHSNFDLWIERYQYCERSAITRWQPVKWRIRNSIIKLIIPLGNDSCNKIAGKHVRNVGYVPEQPLL